MYYYELAEAEAICHYMDEAHDAKSESEIAARLREQAADTLLRAKE